MSGHETIHSYIEFHHNLLYICNLLKHNPLLHICTLRPAAVSGEQQVQPDSRVMVSQSSLSIVEVQDGDQGKYICAAANPAGEDRESATLVIFGEHANI